MLVETKVGKFRIIPLLDGSRLVNSTSTASGWHVVKDGTCTCPGYGYRGRCSHLEAVKGE